MKKVLLMGLIVSMIISLAACSFDLSSIRGKQLSNLLNEEGAKVEEMSTEIIRCFTERDKEAFKELFCERTKQRPEFNDEIDKAFEFLLCDIYTTSEIDRTASGGESIRGGERVSWNVVADIPYFAVLVKTDGEAVDNYNDIEARYYSIKYDWQILCDYDEDLVGLQYLKIELLNVDSFMIGKY
jgi:hypothetical protein